MLKRNEKLKTWLSKGGVAYRDLLIETAGTSIGMIRQWTTGRRNPTAANAGDLVNAMETIAMTYVDAPRPLTRGDLCEACARCPHFLDALHDIDDLK